MLLWAFSGMAIVFEVLPKNALGVICTQKLYYSDYCYEGIYTRSLVALIVWIGTTVFMIIVVCKGRASSRLRHRINGPDCTNNSCCGDCCCASFCLPCVTCQMLLQEDVENKYNLCAPVKAASSG